MSTIQVHETKGAPFERDETHIVEAYGARKCSKLVEQVMSPVLAVKQNSLLVLVDEMNSPQSVHGCILANVMPILANYIASDPDVLTRERASRALALAARDPNGREAMLRHDTAAEVSGALDDQSMKVRMNVLEAVLQFTSATLPAVRALVAARYPATLVAKAASETVQCQPLVLRVLKNCVKANEGLEDALAADAVLTCIELLRSESVEVRKEAATTLGFCCFAEVAKMSAIRQGGVEPLCQLLTDPSSDVRAAAAGALMAVTTTDPGKKAMEPAGGVQPLIDLLNDPSRLVKLNVIKTVANVAVNPSIRGMLKTSTVVLPTLEHLENGEDRLLAKHATIAKAAVLWMP